MKARLTALSCATAVALLAASPGAQAQGTRIDWRTAAPAEGDVLPGEAPGGSAALRVTSAGAGKTVPLTVIRGPAVGGKGYALVGLVRYAGVKGAGYLEMWSVFSDGQRYFSRTVEKRGPLAALSGDSGWRRFELPFILRGAERPSRLELNLVLPGRGTVWLGPVELVAEFPAAAGQDAWWSSQTAGLLGALGGSLLGLLGAAIGSLAGRGRARKLVLGLAWAILGAGVGAFALAIVALLDSQPREVWFPLFLFASIALVFLALIPSLRRRYAAMELRRIQSEDLGRDVKPLRGA